MSHEYTREEILALLHERNNWGRWGDDDQVGAVNLITDEKRIEAAGLVRTGRTVSLSRPFPTAPGPTNPKPAQRYTIRGTRGTGGFSGDYYGIEYHGLITTHVDALCHVWDENGMWQGRDADVELTFDGSNWGSIDAWQQGIVTRGVLLDVPRFRGTDYVTFEEPVHADEVEAVARAQGVEVRPGDALVVYSGRDAWNREHPVWGSEFTDDGEPRRPGLHASCLAYLRDTDVSLLAWDMQDYMPNPWGIPWTVHGAVFSYGIAIADHCLLEPLAAAAAEEGRYEFMFMLSPLFVPGGTGSPANPLAVF